MTPNGFPLEDFLEGAQKSSTIDWVRPTGAPVTLSPLRVDIGFGPNALEVVLAESFAAPKMDDVRKLWRLRWAQRANPVLMVAAYPNGDRWEATVCGPEEGSAAITGLDLRQVERTAAAALKEQNPSAAKRTLTELLVSTKDQLVTGLTNQGLFASHELRHGVPARPDWDAANKAGASLLAETGGELVKALGYTATPVGSVANIISANGMQRAVAVLLEESELFDRPGNRFGAVSPVTHGLALAQERSLPWLVVVNGPRLRLYPAKPDVGVGRKGQSETFVELNLTHLTVEDAGYLPLIFGPEGLTAGGSVDQILAASVDHATGLGARLRERVYVDVVPRLAVAVANAMKADNGADLDDEDLHEAYHRTLIILFRLLFVSYAEDRGLLPYNRNPRYTRKALKTAARELAAEPDISFDPSTFDRWDDLQSVWRAVDDGNREWDVPAYNGGLFNVDPDLHPSGFAISQMRLSNAEIGPALRSLLVDTSDDGITGPVDFRALSVREFGTIYEGLLESSLSVAPTDLTVDPETLAYVPAHAGDTVDVTAGDIYFHNASGARKATGSYFTKSFAVEHLLDNALEPAVTEHLAKVDARLDAGDEAGATDRFFDFRVADIAMGSGHFLVAAIDRIESRFATFLAKRPLAAVSDELGRLTAAAHAALGDAADDVTIEPSMLLRRQIARRCIYGLDLNVMAVELARLAIWIHTFVPGLPMSSLEHGLRVGNSLTGIGTIDEVLDAFEPDRHTTGMVSFFESRIEDTLAAARERLLRLGRTSEATKQEVKEAARAYAAAMAESADARALMDAAAVMRTGAIPLETDPDEAIAAAETSTVRDVVDEFGMTHLPYLFPEVFLRENPGFDVVLGNPPWDEVMVEEPKFWQRYYPGVMGLKPDAQKKRVRELRKQRPDLLPVLEAEEAEMARLRSVLMSGPYPGLTTGDVDYYKAFAWRDWEVLRSGGRLGVVFPRSLLTASGSAAWRESTLSLGDFYSTVVLVNNREWLFEKVHPQYSVVLLNVRKEPSASGEVRMAGPFFSLDDFRAGARSLGSLKVSILRDWGNGATFPVLPDTRATEIFAKFRKHPRLDGAKGLGFKPIAEFHATTDRPVFDEDGYAEGRWPVYTGETFNLWKPDAGDPYAWADPQKVMTALFEKRARQIRRRTSAFYGLSTRIASDIKTLPCLYPRIVFRDVARATDSRTVIAALAPGNAVLTNKAPYLWSATASGADTAYMLGVLSSIPFDWYARRFVELGLSYGILNSFPVPIRDAVSGIQQRVVEVAGRLAAVDSRYKDWAVQVGVPVGSVKDDAAKEELLAELDALVAHLYGLDDDDLQHVYATFHRGADYSVRATAAARHFEAWSGKS